MDIRIEVEGKDVLALDSLTEFQGNLKELSKENYEKLKKDILTLGFSSPLHVWKDGSEYYCLDGHQRIRTLKKMREEGIDVPLIQVVYVAAKNRKEAKLKLLSLASQFGKVTGDGLYEFMSESDISLSEVEEQFHFHEIKFSQFEKEFYAEEPVEGEDDVPEARDTTITRGDLYCLGEHRLLCGDSTAPEDIALLLNGKKADLVFTDPPYNANYSSRVDKKRRKPWGGIKNDNMSDEAFDSFLADVHAVLKSSVIDGASIYECIDWKRYPQMQNIFTKTFDQKAMIVWNKNYFGLGTYYRTKHELILFGIKGGKPKCWKAGRDEMDVWDIKRETLKEYQHPTQKPVVIPERAIRNSSREGNIVLDLFLGSGSTLIASEKTRRICYGMELEPQYCQVIIDRWEKFTGNKAIRYNKKEISKNEIKSRRKKA